MLVGTFRLVLLSYRYTPLALTLTGSIGSLNSRTSTGFSATPLAPLATDEFTTVPLVKSGPSAVVKVVLPSISLPAVSLNVGSVSVTWVLAGRVPMRA